MPELTLTLNDVESKDVNTRRGLSTVYTLKGSDGRTYTTFDRELAVAASELRGKTVVFDYVESKNGDFINYNLNAVTEAAGGVDIPVQTIAATPSTDKDVSIARAVALKAAVETTGP